MYKWIYLFVGYFNLFSKKSNLKSAQLNSPIINGFSSIMLSVDEDDESIVYSMFYVALKHSTKKCERNKIKLIYWILLM